jgi:hypothetical protein
MSFTDAWVWHCAWFDDPLWHAVTPTAFSSPCFFSILEPSMLMRAFSFRFQPAFVFTLCLLFVGSQADAKKPVPFKGNVTATWDNILKSLPPSVGGPGLVSNFTGGGPVTHMGNTTQSGTLTLGDPIAPFVFPGTGTVTITAANGDTVTFNYVGRLVASTGEGIGTFTFTGGTGRFAGATGGGTFYAVIDLSQETAQPMKVVLDGRIAY